MKDMGGIHWIEVGVTLGHAYELYGFCLFLGCLGVHAFLFAFYGWLRSRRRRPVPVELV